MSYSSEVLADSPLCYLRLGDASGTTAADASGNSHPGTYVGSPTLGVAGLLTGDANTAVTLDGSTQYVQIANSGWANLSTYTVEIVFKTTATSGTLCSQYDGSGSSLRIWQFNLNSDGSLQFATFASNVGTGNNTASTGFNDGNRHFAAVTLTGSTLKIYVDGNLEFSSTTIPAHDTSSGAKLYVGQRNAATPLRLAGTVDEFAIYSTALSSTRVTAHHAAGAPVSGTASAPLGGLTASATGVRTRPGTAAAALGRVTATVTGTRTAPGTATAPLGGLTAQASEATPEIDGTATAALGGLTASAASVRATLGAATAALGALTATATGVRTDRGTASSQLGSLVAAAVGSVAHRGVALADLGALIAAAVGTVIGPIVAPTPDPFQWGFTMLAPDAALIPVEAGLDFIEWGFTMLEPGEALIGDPA
jgi:hypothetical protein